MLRRVSRWARTKKPKLTTLGAILQAAKSKRIPFNQALYLCNGQPWERSATGALIECKKDDAIDDVPEFARQNKLLRVLGGGDVEGIVQNALIQKSNVSLEELVSAFNYYVDHDAFIDFSTNAAAGGSKPPAK